MERPLVDGPQAGVPAALAAQVVELEEVGHLAVLVDLDHLQLDHLEVEELHLHWGSPS